MQNQQFDDLMRSAAQARTRRGMLRALGGSVLGAGLTWRGSGEATAACKKPGKKCDKNKDCCNKKCKGGRKGKKGKCQCMKIRRRCLSFVDFNDCCGDEVCEAALGGGKRCCRPEGEVCKLTFGTRACRDGLVCDVDDTLTCVKLGSGG